MEFFRPKRKRRQSFVKSAVPAARRAQSPQTMAGSNGSDLARCDSRCSKWTLPFYRGTNGTSGTMAWFFGHFCKGCGAYRRRFGKKEFVSRLFIGLSWCLVPQHKHKNHSCCLTQGAEKSRKNGDKSVFTWKNVVKAMLKLSTSIIWYANIYQYRNTISSMLYISIHSYISPIHIVISYPSYIQKTISSHLGGGIQICGLGELRLLQNGRWSALPRPENYRCTEVIRMDFDVFWCILGKSHEKLDHRNRLNFQVEQDTKIDVVSSQTEAAAAQSPWSWASKMHLTIDVRCRSMHRKSPASFFAHATMPPTKKPSMLGFLISSAPWKVDF